MWRVVKFCSMILNGCLAGSMTTRLLTCKSTNNSSLTYFSHQLTQNAPVNVILGSQYRESKHLPLRGWNTKHLSSASTNLLRGDHGSFTNMLPFFPTRSTVLPRHRMVPRASKDVPYSFRFPPMTKKPKWWWRTLACIPYLMPLHETWMYAETAYHLHPFLEDFEFFTYPFLGFIGRLPSWFLMAYFFAAYLGVVRKKEWPHFFRFHVVMGMLLEIALQVIGTVSRWMPLAMYWGKIGMHFWTAVAFAYLFTVLECMRCALGGMYADIPFVCDAAYIQIPYD
ncbi:protein TIC 20-I, chloroplastic-like isoform X1 [Typha latifolia]|uniref:protein TIC 20-I, chloroplastic-like isoform X1 n=2 Tax=Typha latifolia TaxID=4733 RepID=UPI003C2DDAD1